MKICAIMFTGCLLILLLAACGEESDLPDDPVEEEEYDVVKYNYRIYGYRSDFVDALGKVLGKPPGEEITKEELATLTRLHIPYFDNGHHQIPTGLSYDDMALLAYCVNLQVLDTSFNEISDLSPLVGLTDLTELHISSNGHLDLSPLARLTNLTELNLFANGPLDLSPLAGLINLTKLNLSRNEISDIRLPAGLVNLQQLNLGSNNIANITPLAELVNLQHLHLRGNFISDITPLSGLIHLQQIYLSDNQIVHLKPLVDNPGLANENPAHLGLWAVVVGVGNNPLSDVSRNEHIPALKARGVIVRH